MARRLKVENGKLAKRDARKSRVSINWVKHKRTNKHKVRYEPSPTYSTSADPFTKKACIALATAGKYTKVKGDVSGAFRQVITPRGERAIRMPKHLRTYNSNGEEEYIVVNTSVEGEPFSGYEWDTKFLNDRLEIGWKLVPGVPGMMVYKDCVMIGEVDDFMILEPSENRMKLSALTIHLLSQRYTAIDGAPAIKVDPEPEIYAGVEMATSMERDRCTLRTDQKIREAARAHVPAVVDKDVTGIKDLNLLKGTALSKALENLALAPLPPGVKANEIKLTEQQKCMMQLAGSLRFPAEYTPALELPLCKISRVVARAPEGAYRVGQSVVAAFYKEIETKKGKGITYQAGKDAPRMQVAMKGEARYIDDGKDVEYKGQSGVKLKDGAAARLETFADATWGKLEELEPSYFDQDGVLTKEAFEQVVRESPKDIYGILVTLAGASVAAKSKALKIITSCSMDAERHASTKVSELAELGRLIERAFGYDMSMPTLLATDNLPHLRVTQGEASASRSRHLLRRYLQIRQSMQAGDVKTRFVSDVENPSDFLTKFLDRIKLEASLEYVTNSKNAVDETPKELIAQSKEWYAQAIANACKMDERAAMDSPTFSAKVANLDGDIIEESQLEAVYSAALARAYSAMQA